MTLHNIQEAESALLPYVPLVGQVKADTTLERVWPLMELLGNPQDQLKTIHIAGTSGKTSTAYYMAALLAASGKKVGLTVSPHVDSVTERVQINGQPIPEELFCQELGEFLEIIEQAAQKPSYFELLYAFAIWVFAQQKLDYIVVETGMGGLHDASNVSRRADKLCVITDIGLDHTHILGNTLADITAQKAGIIHEHNQVFMYQQAPEIMEVAERRVKDHNATLNIVAGYEGGKTDLPDYQLRNWQLAHEIYKYLIIRDDLQHLTSQVLQETQHVLIPARMETKQVKGKTVIMDGAHNAQKMTAFLESFKHLYPNVKPAILLGLKEGKEYQELIPILAPIASRVITTVFNTSQDLPARSIDPAILSKLFIDQGIEAETITDQKAAVQALLNSPESVCVITGSFYMLSQIRNNGYLE